MAINGDIWDPKPRVTIIKVKLNVFELITTSTRCLPSEFLPPLLVPMGCEDPFRVATRPSTIALKKFHVQALKNCRESPEEL